MALSRIPHWLGTARSFARAFFGFARWRAAAAIGLIAAGALAEGVGILLLVPMFGIIMGRAGEAAEVPGASALLDWLPAAAPERLLAWFLAAFLAAMIARSAIILARDVLLARLQARFVQHQRMTVLAGLAEARWESIVRLSHGRITHVLTNDIDRTGVAVYCFLQILVGLILIATQVLLAFMLAPLLALLSLTLLAIPSVSLMVLFKRAGGAGWRLTTTHLQLMSNTRNYLGGLKQSIGENRQHVFVRKAEETLDLLSDTQVGIVRHQTLAKVATATAGGVVAVAALWIGHAVLALPAPVLIAFLLLLARLSGPAIQLQQGLMQMATCLPAYGSVRALQAELGRQPPPAPAAPVDRSPRFDIVFEDVTYLHAAGDESAPGGSGVRNLDLSIGEGEFVGLTGRSGSGKTTCADLIAGLLLPQSGQIRVGGRVLDGASASAWRQSIAYVDQDSFLFHGNVRDNLDWGSGDFADREIWDALAVAGAVDLVDRLPGKLDSVIGERGLMISGGERQRLGIARAVLRRPSVMILDEATNALDPGGQARLLESLRARLPACTIVLISHSHEALEHCDRIVPFDRGRRTA